MGRSFKVGELAEEVEAVVDLLPGEPLQPLRAEAFHRKRTHHPSIKHCTAKHCRSYFTLRGQIAEKSAGKAVSSAGRVHNFIQRQCRCAEGADGLLGAVSRLIWRKESRGAVFAGFP